MSWSAPALGAAAVRVGQDLDGELGGLVLTGLEELSARGSQLDNLGKRALTAASAYHFAGEKEKALAAAGAGSGRSVLARLKANTGEAIDSADAANQLRKDWADIADVAVIVGEKAFQLAIMALLAA